MAKKKTTVVKYAGVTNASHLSLPAKIAVIVISLGVLVAMAMVFFVLPLQEKDAIVKAGLNYKNGAAVVGTYEQDNDAENGAEDIMWRVLTRDGNNIYLIAKEGLDVRPFSASAENASWETSDLKAWLEGEFATTAGLTDPRFTVTLATATDVEKYFDAGADAAVMPTAYALEQGATTIQQGAGVYWLRTAATQANAACVVGVEGALTNAGKVNKEGIDPTTEGIIVRPVLVVSLK